MFRKRHRARRKGLQPIGSQHICSTRDRKLAARPRGNPRMALVSRTRRVSPKMI